MTPDEFRLWLANLIIAATVTTVVWLGFPGWPLWGYILVGFLAALLFPIVPAVNVQAKEKK